MFLNMEIWKDIPNYEGYQVSNLGNVKALPKSRNLYLGGVRHWPEMILKPSQDRSGYLIVTLTNKSGRKRWLIHRIVAVTFIDNVEQKPQVNHLNGIKNDNRLENLEWATISENMKHAFATGLKQPIMCRIGCNNEQNGKSRKIYQYTLDGQFIKEWPSLQEVNRELKFHHANTGACARGKLKTAYGFVWKYAS